MGKPTGFLEVPRELPAKRDPGERIRDYNEVDPRLDYPLTQKQAARCMDCGIPFCHHGCPLGNLIPDFNDAVYQGNWKLAYELLVATNNFPEFTGRICPAPCEASCVLAINKPAVAIEYIEKSIIEKAFAEGWVTPRQPAQRTGRQVAIIGSGPAGLAAAAQLNQAGHMVTVFERADAVGGLLRYGIPDFKLDKQVLDRRLALMKEEGIRFRTHAHVGVNVDVQTLREEFDALLLCGGSTVPRDLPIPGRHLRGVHVAMDFLAQQNSRVSGRKVEGEEIWATGKQVVVIGGGDTGSDCVGTANRHGARSVTQLEIMSQPPRTRTEDMPWPSWPMILRTSTSHEEGCERQWAVLTREFIGDESGQLVALKIADAEVVQVPGQPLSVTEVPGSERQLPCELALLAMGFLHPPREGMLAALGVELDARGMVKCRDYATSEPGVFAAGDMRRGQSLVVWAISEGREAARAVDAYLTGDTQLEAKAQGRLQLG